MTLSNTVKKIIIENHIKKSQSLNGKKEIDNNNKLIQRYFKNIESIDNQNFDTKNIKFISNSYKMFFFNSCFSLGIVYEKKQFFKTKKYWVELDPFIKDDLIRDKILVKTNSYDVLDLYSEFENFPDEYKKELLIQKKKKASAIK